MKYSVALLAALAGSDVEARSAWGTWKGTKKMTSGEDDHSLNFNWYTSYNEEKDMTLYGTFILEFPEGKAPETGKSVRICMALSQPDNEDWGNDKWEQVMLFMPAWDESDWYVTYRKPDGLQDNYCAEQTGDDKLSDSVWSVDKNFWDKDANRLLLDVNRPLEMAEDNDDDAKSLEYGKNIKAVFAYGTWNDKGDRDGGKIRGDKGKGNDKVFKLMILEQARILVFGAATAVASALYMF